jgi:pyruvyl transferase EpsO
MENQQKKAELEQLIRDNLTPLITNDYVLLGLPYHTNIGDSLIWQGELDLLKSLPYKCLYSASRWSYRKMKIKENVIILIQGSGSFGDIWRGNQAFAKTIIESFPNNKIIILSSSICYLNKEILLDDANSFSRHPNLTMCFRDNASLNIANEYFPKANNILVPDMAFYIDMKPWKKYIKPPVKDKILFLRRIDKELNTAQKYDIVPAKAEIHDWPTMEKNSLTYKLFNRILTNVKLMDKLFSSNMNNIIADMAYQRFFRRIFIKKGIRFLSAYSYIYTTRLHTGILSFLLNRKASFFDNSYGKNKGVYDAWLKDLDTIKFI